MYRCRRKMRKMPSNHFHNHSSSQLGSICEWDHAFVELSKFVIVYNIYMVLIWSDTILKNASLQSQRESCDRDTSCKVFVEESEISEQEYVELNEWGVKYVKLIFIEDPHAHSHLSYRQSLLLVSQLFFPAFLGKYVTSRDVSVLVFSLHSFCVFLSERKKSRH